MFVHCIHVTLYYVCMLFIFFCCVYFCFKISYHLTRFIPPLFNRGGAKSFSFPIRHPLLYCVIHIFIIIFWFVLPSHVPSYRPSSNGRIFFFLLVHSIFTTNKPNKQKKKCIFYLSLTLQLALSTIRDLSSFRFIIEIPRF